jgi:uncharacterized protein YndB with AHSA1/START domain
MGPISATAAVDAPRERVYELLCDLAARPAFCDHFIEAYRLQRVDPTGVGASARFRVRRLGWMDTEIEEAVPPYLIRERGRGGRFNRVPVFTVWEVAAGSWSEGCEVTVTFWTEPRNPFDRAKELLGSSRWFRRSWSRALSRLKDLVESERPPQRVTIAGADRIQVVQLGISFRRPCTVLVA